jgi:glutaminyl-peptide cyclotransferase
VNSLAVGPFVTQTYPHDHTSFCQGIIVRKSQLYESSGWYGESRLQVSSWPPGPSQWHVRYPLTDDEFGEDLTFDLSGRRILQATWEENYAIVWSDSPIRRAGAIPITEAESWGICTDVDLGVYYTSHGDSSLVMRDANLQQVSKIDVTFGGSLLGPVNALCYISGHIFANLYPSSDIVIIDPRNGVVEVVLDCSSLIPGGIDEEEDVMNGIAHVADRGEIVVTGKRWPVAYTLSLERIASRL